jgi:hypothetical protein
MFYIKGYENIKIKIEFLFNTTTLQMKSRNCGLINLLVFVLLTLFFLIFLSLSIITPDYDSSRDPPINGLCIGDQIVKLRECINPTCLEGYHVDAGICVESTQYSFLSIYYTVFFAIALMSGLFWGIYGCFLIIYFCIANPFKNEFELELQHERYRVEPPPPYVSGCEQ